MDMKALRRFIDDYNDIGYGNAEVYETEHYFVIKFYNAGFSENEELDSYLKVNKPKFLDLTYHQHPIHIYTIHKGYFMAKYKMPDEVFTPIRVISIKDGKFVYRMEFD